MTEPAGDPRLALHAAGTTVLAWAGLIAVIAMAYLGADGLAALLVGARDSAEMVVFARPRRLGKELFYALVFAPVLLLAAIAIARRLIVALLLTTAVYVALAYLNWYAPYTAITFHRDRIELHYLWPRQSAFVETQSIGSMDVVLSGEPRGEGGSDTLYALEITAPSGKFVSMASAGKGGIIATRERIAHMRRKRTGAD